MSEVLPAAGASSSHLTQNGDSGASVPRPGDGNYLIKGAAPRGNRGHGGRGRGSQGARGPPGPSRGSSRRPQSVSEMPIPAPPPTLLPPIDSHDLYSMYSGPSSGFNGFGDNWRPPAGGAIPIVKPPPTITTPNDAASSGRRANGGNEEVQRNGVVPPATPHPVIQPRAEAAKRAEPIINGYHSNLTSNGHVDRQGSSSTSTPPSQPRMRSAPSSHQVVTPRHPIPTATGSNNGQSSINPTESTTEQRGGRPSRSVERGSGGTGEVVRERPAHMDRPLPSRDLSTQFGQGPSTGNLKATAAAFTPLLPPTEALNQMSLSPSQASLAPGPSHSVDTSRTSSGEGRRRANESGTRTPSHPRERRGKPAQPQPAESEHYVGVTETDVPAPIPAPVVPKSNRRAAFEQQTKLTTAGDRVEAAKLSEQEEQATEKVQEKTTRGPVYKKKEEKDDLISRLTRGLGKRPFVECPICFNSITPSQPIFCCSPPTAPPPPSLDDDAPTNYYQACYAPFHLSCIRDWADRSLAEESEKIRTNLLVENDGKVKRPEWRCPGCQKRRVDRVGLYNFCATLVPVLLAQKVSRSVVIVEKISGWKRADGERTTRCSVPKHPKVAWRSIGRAAGDVAGYAMRRLTAGYIPARKLVILIPSSLSLAPTRLPRSLHVPVTKRRFLCSVNLTVPNQPGRNALTRYQPVPFLAHAQGHAAINALSLVMMATVHPATRMWSGHAAAARVCSVCGRHECSRICCPLSYKAKSSRIKKKAGATNDLQDLVAPGEEDLHACSLTCGKWLSCGLHTCQRKDHRGACGRCLQASYDELICHCGESIIYPPVACGTTITCAYPCARPAPTCGHPKTIHSCHEASACPPCPYLTTRPCACGKDPAVKNVRCSQSIVSCGQTCGNLLSCGYHRCDKTCHKQGEGECGDCTQVCGKPKRVCRHPCTSVCHAPAKCPESDPCGAIVDQKCACGNLSNRTTCGASANNSGTKGESRELVQLKCNSECLVKQRNARLAEALGIKGAEARAGSADATEWSAELKVFAQGNLAFVKTVESALADFWKGGKSSHILPQMPAAKRTFVLSLAQAYRLLTELLDAAPNRSIMIRRKIDTRIPNPLLSASVTPRGTSINGEKKTALANLRPTTTTAGGSWGKVLAPTPKTASPWGNPAVSGASTPSTYSTPMGSRAISPAVTPGVDAPAHAPVPANHSSQVGGVGLGLARVGSSRQGVVGQVGKVEEDDWDVDA